MALSRLQARYPVPRFLRPALVAVALLVASIGQSGPASAQSATPCATPAAGASTPAASPAAAAALPTQAAAEAETNPPGDIPDDQAFVTYTSQADQYSMTAPEGWSRQEQGSSVVLSDKLHRFTVDIVCAATPPTEASVQQEANTVLARSLPAFELVNIETRNVPAGTAILVQYRVNSDVDPVTGVQHRLDVDRYEIPGAGKIAVVSLAGPAGSDNVDVSRQVSESFRWIG